MVPILPIIRAGLPLKRLFRSVTSQSLVFNSVFTNDFSSYLKLKEKLWKWVLYTSITRPSVVQDNFPFLGVKGA